MVVLRAALVIQAPLVPHREGRTAKDHSLGLYLSGE